MNTSPFSQEQIVGILREGDLEGRTLAEFFRQYGIYEHNYYRWRRRFGVTELAEVEGLRGHAVKSRASQWLNSELKNAQTPPQDPRDWRQNAKTRYH